MSRAILTPRAAGAVSPRRRLGGALPLRHTDVDVWRVSLDRQSEETMSFLRGLLSPDELKRARDFYFERDRERFTVARGILRVILGRYLGKPPATIAFRYGPNGKPGLAGDDPPPIHFNVAHSEDLALLAVTRTGEIGVDIEHVRDLPDWEQIAATCFSAAEHARLQTLEMAARREEFFRAWTRQEAALKASGVGLGGAVPRHDPDTGRALADDTDNPAFCTRPASGWRVFPLYPAPGFAASLAVGPTARWAACGTWEASQWIARGQAPRRGRRVRLDQWSDFGATFL